MISRWLLTLVAVCMLSPLGLIANEAQPLADDPVLEARLKVMSQELRCLVCQNQTLADSNAPLAEDLRREIRTQMSAGKSDQEVMDYLVARYGDFVRYRPPVNKGTALLWLGPFLGLLLGAVFLIRSLKKRAGNESFESEDV